MNQQLLEKLLGPHKVVAVMGGQWGDEGKGKIVDLFSGWAQVVARGNGGANAGHTIQVDGKQLVLHLVPSGIKHDKDGVTNVCGSGMVIDPRALLEELAMLTREGVSYNHLQLSHNATLVLPQHVLLDRLREQKAGGGKIGTTGRGIGPAYADKVGRIALRVNDLLNPDIFVEKLKKATVEHSRLLKGFDPEAVEKLAKELYPGLAGTGGEPFSFSYLIQSYLEMGKRLAPHIANSDFLMGVCKEGGARVLLEGAQGRLLGIEGGTYPHVTASDCSLAGLARGVGLRESDVEQSFVVAKAFYMTRVGAGQFPTEFGRTTIGRQSEEWCNSGEVTRETERESFPDACVNSADEFAQGVAIRQAGNEYGATTGRPRRTGWLDLVLLKHVLNDTPNAKLILTKLDVLDSCKTIKLATRHVYNGHDYRRANDLVRAGDALAEAVMDGAYLHYCHPEYEEYPGWLTPLGCLKVAEELPKELLTLIGRVEEFTKTKAAAISVGPERNQTIAL